MNVQLIIDGKVNEKKDKKGKIQESFPREENLRMLAKAHIPKANVILREAKPNNIEHNKFIVLLKGAAQVPTEVWTGSTNISEGKSMARPMWGTGSATRTSPSSIAHIGNC